MSDRGEGNNEAHYTARYPTLEGLLEAMFGKVRKAQRHPSILRTNHQIYHEASAFLYSDVTIGLSPGYALALTATPGNAVVSQNTKIWRHLRPLPRDLPDSQCQTAYEPYLPDKFMKPQVFSRFEKLYYNGRFDFSYDASAPTIHINDDLSTEVEDDSNFFSYLTTATKPTQLYKDLSLSPQYDIFMRNLFKQTLKNAADGPLSSITVTYPTTADVFRRLGDLFSASPFIRDLELDLEIHVSATTLLDEIRPGEDGYCEQQFILNQRALAANERATELFLESGVLDPLRRLSNVKEFNVRICTQGRGGLIMISKKRYSSMMEDLKNVIQKNWVLRHGSC